MYLQSPYKGIPPWDSNVSPTLDSIYFMVDDKNSVTSVVTYWLLSLNVIKECPSLAYVVVIADKRGIVTIYACAFVVLCAGSATDLGAL